MLQNFGNKNSLKRIKMWNNKKAFSFLAKYPREKKTEKKHRKNYLPNDT